MNKLIYVQGDDFSAAFFEDWVESNKLSFEEACELGTIEDDEGYAEVSVLSFGEICPKFIQFVYDSQDYEHSKNENFYFSNNKIFIHEVL